ncbi:OmpH family outer membrane protein [Armatimonas sp.]|uniref:OmpH family outer membrane protein n=1 Tax=Armatimonas sp. TaxID=1872638 RepID=UPI00375077C1
MRALRAIQSFRLFAPVALTLLGGVGIPALTPAPAHAQQQFGIVDFQECAKQSKLKKDLDGQFETFKRSMLGVFNRLKEGNAIFLTKQEMTELAAIYEKSDKTTPAEKTRAADLQKKADQSAGTLNRLGGQQLLKDDEKKELERLNALQNEGIPILNEIGADYERRITEKGTNFETQLEKIVKDAVKKVAQEKSLALIFNANVVIYAATDITEDVVKLLQK